MRLQILQADEEHIEELSWTMREADKAEVWALSHWTPGEALVQSVHPPVCQSSESYAAKVEGELVAMFGVVCVLREEGPIGVPWVLGAESLTKYPLTMVKTSRKWLKQFQQRYDYLGNYVDSRYTAAVHWIEALGFTISPAAPCGPDGVPFHWFEWRAA